MFVAKIYECGICGGYHPWEWDGDCRDNENRLGGPDDYARKFGIDEYCVEAVDWEDRVAADVEDAYLEERLGDSN